MVRFWSISGQYLGSYSNNYFYGPRNEILGEIKGSLVLKNNKLIGNINTLGFDYVVRGGNILRGSSIIATKDTRANELETKIFFTYFYNNFDLSLEKTTWADYPQQAVDNAKKGIELNEKINNSCATDVGKQRAQDIANKRGLSFDVIKRTYSYLSRAEEFYNPEDEKACGTISYLLWGGKSMKSWAESKIKEIENK